MGLLTREAERRILERVLVNPSNPNTAFTQPIMIHLMATNGSSESPGTEISGDSYEEVSVNWAQSSAAPQVEYINTSAISFNLLDLDSSVTVVGIELWDSSTTPVRVAFAALASPVTIPAGQPFSVSAGQLKVSLT